MFCVQVNQVAWIEVWKVRGSDLPSPLHGTEGWRPAPPVTVTRERGGNKGLGRRDKTK